MQDFQFHAKEYWDMSNAVTIVGYRPIGHVIGHALGEPAPQQTSMRPIGHTVGHAIGELPPGRRLAVVDIGAMPDRDRAEYPQEIAA
jgi:hypothetical protein